MHPVDLLSLSLTRTVICGHTWPEDGTQERVKDESVILQCLPHLTYSPRSGLIRSRCHEFIFTFLTTYFYSPFQMDFPVHSAFGSTFTMLSSQPGQHALTTNEVEHIQHAIQ